MDKKIHLSTSINNLDLTGFSNEKDYVSNFENHVQSFLDTKKEVVALNSGTSAIHLALIIGGITKDDIVICQSFTFVATANPIIYQGATPIFVGSELNTFNMCPVQLENAILESIENGKKPKAIIYVQLYGRPAEVDKIIAISKKYNILLIEDAAEAYGATYKGKKCGTLGDYSILSFNNNKIVTAFGGGVLVCNSKKEKEKALFFATQAKDKAPYYQHSKIGYNYRMSKLTAFIGLNQLQTFKDHLNKRTEINNFYLELFQNIKGIDLVTSKDIINTYSNNWLSLILINQPQTGFSANDLRIVLSNKNIESRLFWKPMHLQPIFKKYVCYGEKNANELFKKGLCLPSGSNLTKDDLIKIKKTIINFVNYKRIKD